MITLLIILIVLMCLGGIGTGPYMPYWGTRSYGWAPSGILWLLALILLAYLILGTAHTAP